MLFRLFIDHRFILFVFQTVFILEHHCTGCDLLYECRIAKSAFEAYSADEKYFSVLESNRLSELEADEDLRIALRAAAERIIRSAKIKFTNSSRVRPSKESTESFIKLLHERLNFKVPDWWKKGINESQYIGVLTIPLPDYRKFYNRVKTEEFWVSKNITIDPSNKEFILLRIDQRTLKLSRDLVDKTNIEGVTGIVAVIHEDRCFLSLLSYRGQPYSIYCFDLLEQRQLWKQIVWATGPIINYSGRSVTPSYGELIFQDGVLYLFGAASDGAYIEAFNGDNGSVEFRFSTSY